MCAKKDPNAEEDEDVLFGDDQFDEVDFDANMEKKGRLNSFAELVYELFVTGLAANIASFQNDSVCKFTRQDIIAAHHEFKLNPDSIN